VLIAGCWNWLLGLELELELGYYGFFSRSSISQCNQTPDSGRFLLFWGSALPHTLGARIPLEADTPTDGEMPLNQYLADSNACP
jgi:hypothetical protein